MLAFVIPLRSKLKSKNWAKEEKLLERTIRSILNQSNNNFRIFVVYSDLPKIAIVDDRIQFIAFPYEFLKASEILDMYPQPIKTAVWLENNMDKGRKIMYGCKIAKSTGCDYIMEIDSDDLISKHISQFIHEQISFKKPGWYISKGYIYEEGKKYVIKQPSKMNFLNGSTHILREDLIVIPDFISNKTSDYFLYNDHGYLKERIFLEFNEVLEPLPFYGNIYIVSGNNQSAIVAIVGSRNIKNLIKMLLRGKLLTQKLKTEFGLYKIII